MYSKISVALIAALAAGTQAWDGHDFHGHLHKNGTYTHPSHPHESGHGPHSHPGPFSANPSELATSAVPSIPLTTGTSGSASGSGPGESGDTTLTYTLGSGLSTIVITTTIHRTETEVNTVYATSGPAEAAETGPSATVRRTIYSTIFVTPEATPTGSGSGEESGATGAPASGVPASPTGGSGAGESGAQDSGVPGNGALGSSAQESGASGACAPQVTVTVTAAEQTVTVTAGSAPTGSSPGSGESPASQGGAGEAPTAAPSLHGPVNPYTVYSAKTVKKTRTKCASTGFITKPSASFTLHPTGTGMFPINGTGVPALRK